MIELVSLESNWFRRLSIYLSEIIDSSFISELSGCLYKEHRAMAVATTTTIITVATAIFLVTDD